MYLNYAPMAGLSVLFRLFGWLLGRSDGCFARARACPDGMQPGGAAVWPGRVLCGSEYLLRVFILFNDKD